MAKPASGKVFSIINVGSYSIKAIKCSVEDRKFRIHGWKTHRNQQALTTQSSFNDYIAELERAIIHFKADLFVDFESVHFMFSSSFMIVKILGVPGFAKSELKNLIRDKLERDNSVSARQGGLEAFKYVTSAFDNLKEEDKIEEQMDVAVLALLAEKEVLDRLVGFASSIRISIAGIWSELTGIAGLVKFIDPQSWNGQVAVVNVGHTLTTFQIFSEGKCLFYRPIFTGGQAITNDVLTITSDETIDARQAEELKHKICLNPKSVDSTALTPLEALIHTISEQAALREFSLVRKLDISFEYLSVGLKKRIQKVLYIGGTANLEGLTHYISRNTTLPAGTALDLESRSTLNVPLPEDEGKHAFLSYAPSLGLANALSEGLYSTLDLYKSEGAMAFLRPEKVLLYVKKYVGRALIATEALILVYVLVTFLQQYYANIKRADELREAIRVAPQIPMKEPPDDLEDLTKVNNELRRKLVFYNMTLKTRRNWVDLYSEIARAVPQNVALTNVELETREIVEAAPEEEKKEEAGAAGGGGGQGAGMSMGSGMSGSTTEAPKDRPVHKYSYHIKLEGSVPELELAQTADYVQKLKESGSFQKIQLLTVGTSTDAGGLGAALGGGQNATTRPGNLPFVIEMDL